VSQAGQVLWFDAVPLLLVAAAYLVASGLLGPSLWAERRGASLLDLAIFLVFPMFGLAAAAFGISVAVDRKPIVGGVWGTFAVTVAVGIPALLALARWRERASVGRGPRHGRQLESVAAITTALGRTDDAATVAEALLEEVERLVEAELACLMVVDPDAREATGVLGRARGRPLEWFSDLRIELDGEPSGVAQAAVVRAPFSVYDSQDSPALDRRLVESTGAKSVAFIPLVADQRVIAVLIVGSITERRAFAAEDPNRGDSPGGRGCLSQARWVGVAGALAGGVPPTLRRAPVGARPFGARSREASPRRRPRDGRGPGRRPVLHPPR
jgi:hypothetical protein